jgi:hypothetical protein
MKKILSMLFILLVMTLPNMASSGTISASETNTIEVLSPQVEVELLEVEDCVYVFTFVNGELVDIDVYC